MMRRKGRPQIGKQRAYSCSTADYELLKQAAKAVGKKTATFVREAAIARAHEILDK